MENEDIVIELTTLREKVTAIEKRQDEYCKKVDNMNAKFFAIMSGVLLSCVGVIFELIILLNKKVP